MMTSTGWHQDPTDPTTSRYWDGNGWKGELRWNGTEWVGTDAPAEPDHSLLPPPPAAAGPTNAPAESPFAAQVASITAKISELPIPRSSALLLGGAGLAGLGVLLPWERVSAPYGQSQVQTPTSLGAAAVLLLALAGAVGWVGWCARTGRTSMSKLVGVVMATAAMSFFVVAKFSAIGADQARANDAMKSINSGITAYGIAPTVHIAVEPGFGLYLWTLGVLVAWAGVARMLRDRKS